jgi:hypothetical protein
MPVRSLPFLKAVRCTIDTSAEWRQISRMEFSGGTACRKLHPSMILHSAGSRFKSRARLEGENLVLRHQLNVLRRQAPKRARLTNADRLLFVCLYRVLPSILDAVTIIKPATVIRWHRRGFRWYWRWKSRGRGGSRARTPGVGVCAIKVRPIVDFRT